MPPLSLDIRDAITVVTGILTIAGVIFALRAAVSKLEVGQGEVIRQLGALHKRMDHYGDLITRIDKDHVRLDERVKALKESQQFRLRSRLAVSEAAQSGETPMFLDDEGGE